MRVMHRDLKTQNIFLGRGGVIKLGDFGISRVLERTDDFATTVTARLTTSPGGVHQPATSLKSDVWAFGCVAYEIATLRHAFAADSLLSLVHQIVNGTCPRAQGEVRRRFAKIVARTRSVTIDAVRTSRPCCRASSCRSTCGGCGGRLEGRDRVSEGGRRGQARDGSARLVGAPTGGGDGGDRRAGSARGSAATTRGGRWRRRRWKGDATKRRWRRRGGATGRRWRREGGATGRRRRALGGTPPRICQT